MPVQSFSFSDTPGNQIVSELLVKNIARRGYFLAIERDVIHSV